MEIDAKVLKVLVNTFQRTDSNEDFVSIVDCVRRPITLNLCLLVTADEADESLQDFVVKLWRIRRTLDADLHGPGYFVQMAKNIAIDRYRRSQVEHEHLEAYRTTVGEAWERRQREAAQIIEAEDGAVAEFMSSLSDIDKMIVKHYVDDDEACAIAAKKIGITSRSLNRRYGKMKERLKKVMEKQSAKR